MATAIHPGLRALLDQGAGAPLTLPADQPRQDVPFSMEVSPFLKEILAGQESAPERLGLFETFLRSTARSAVELVTFGEFEKQTVQRLGLERSEAKTPAAIFAQTAGEILGQLPLDIGLGFALAGTAGLAGPALAARGAAKGGKLLKLGRSLSEIGAGAFKKPASFAAAEVGATLGAAVLGGAATAAAPDSPITQAVATIAGGLLGGVRPLSVVRRAGAIELTAEKIKNYKKASYIIDEMAPELRPEFMTKLQRGYQQTVGSEFSLTVAEAQARDKRGLGPVTLTAGQRFGQVLAARKRSTDRVDSLVEKAFRPVFDSGTDQVFEDLVDSERILTRVLNGVPTRGHTPKTAQAKLDKVLNFLGPEDKAIVVAASKEQQKEFRYLADRWLESGILNAEGHAFMKWNNEYYAPTRLLDWMEEGGDAVGGSGALHSKNLTSQNVLKALKGFKEADRKQLSIFDAAIDHIGKGHILAEKNDAMLVLDRLARVDIEGDFVKYIKKDAAPRKGWDKVGFFKNGEHVFQEVRPEIGKTIEGLGAVGANIAIETLSAFKSGLTVGAISLSLPFQITNLLFADMARLGLSSEARLRGSDLAGKFLGDLAMGIFSSATNNSRSVKKLMKSVQEGGGVLSKKAGEAVQLADELGNIGAAGTSRARRQRPGAFSAFTPDDLRGKSMTKALNPIRTTLDSTAKFSSFIEEITKMTGLRRLKRFKNIDAIMKGDRSDLLMEMNVELRQMVGSPDFGRSGSVTRGWYLNVMFPFLNARIQGTTADLSRLLFTTGRKDWKKGLKAHRNLMIGAGLPTIGLHVFNHLPENKDDFDKITEDEKQRYHMIPTDTRFTNFRGESTREYIRIPKREIGGMYASVIEEFMNTLRDGDPVSYVKFSLELLEEISPLNLRFAKGDRDTFNVGSQLSSLAQSMLSGLNPAIKLPLELSSGRDFFRQRDIVPLHRQGPDVPGHLQGTGREGELFTVLSKELNISVAKLEKMAKDLTGGLVGSLLLPPQQAADRTLREARSHPIYGPVIRRFTRSEFTRLSDEEQIFQDAANDNRAQSIERGLLSQKAAEEIARMDSTGRYAAMTALKRSDPDLFDLVEPKLLRGSLTPIERALSNMSVRDGTRDLYIAKWFMETMPQDRAGLMDQLRKKKIFTPSVQRNVFLNNSLSLLRTQQAREEAL